MSLKAIKILNFRNYESLELNNFGNFNLLLGANGSGKTNFLEAVFVLSQGRPFRKVPMEDLIRWDMNSFYIGGEFDGNKKEIGYSFQKKILRQNNQSVGRIEFLHDGPAVVFLPDDIAIVTGAPEERRDFMDRTLSLFDRDYAGSLLLYQNVLRQRNAQLKLSPGEVYLWNDDFIKTGSRIIEKRILFMRNIGSRIKDIYREFYSDDIELKYFNTFKIEGGIETSFARALQEISGLEKIRKTSLAGPHRDNFEIRKLDKKSKSFASRGQMRLLALALKLSLLETFDKNAGKPVLLLDDVLLEMDGRSKKIFLEKTVLYQKFLTATSADLLSGIDEPAFIYRVENGKIIR